ncbi:hypothetical protein D9615_006926 [Tricholomella constricta]|uniref:F-box domain-containing protein n=1 Tax=Tricholomella constricta TaxID=117010 RepID=A0A8H5H8V2_9AGAR|nr:hypothetical protein D9615_006926 [Tricholomella constricta]
MDSPSSESKTIQSIIDTLLSTGDNPSETEVKTLRLHHSACAEEILEIDTIVAPLQRQILEMQMKRTVLQTEHDSCAVLLAPIRRVLPEILQAIFLACLPAELEDCYPDQSQAPLLLCQVSSQWRTLALHTPRLWSNLVIDLCEKATSVVALKRCTRLTKTWLRRSGSHVPISLYFKSHSRSSDENSVIEAFMTSVVVPRLHRFRELLLDITVHGGYMPSILSHKPALFERMERFALITNYMARWDINAITLSLMSAKRLHTVNLYDVLCDAPTIPLAIPWGQLTSLKTGVVYPGPLVVILSQCINLEHGDFSVYNPSFPIPALDVIMPRLSSLKIRFSTGGDASFFDRIKFPVLQNLQIKTDETSDGHFSWANPGHFYNELRNLTTLTFAGGISDLANLLRHTPSIASLTLSSKDNLDELLEAMTHDKAPYIAPILEILHIKPYWTKLQHSPAPSLGSAILGAMVSSRRAGRTPPGTSPLQQIVFEGGPEHLARIRPALIRLKLYFPHITVITQPVRSSFAISALRDFY